VPVDVRALGCDFYAGSGQKWMCGPVGTGMLWVSPEWRERLPPVGATWLNLADPHDPLGSGPQADARRHDTAALAPEWSAASVAAHDVFAAHGWHEVHRRARTLASQLAERLRESGRTVAERDATTLVSWEDPEPEVTRDRLAAERIIIRNLPGTSYVRASVGAWNDEGDLDRMLAAIG
jgi:L-cysteine/cystine lyase